MLLNRRYLPPPQTPVRCQNCQDLNLRDPKIKGILGIPLEALRISSDLGCPCCHVLVRALDLPDLQPPAGDSLFGVTLLAHNASVDDYSEEPSRPLIMRLQTEYRHYAEVEIFTEEGKSGAHSGLIDYLIMLFSSSRPSVPLARHRTCSCHQRGCRLGGMYEIDTILDFGLLDQASEMLYFHYGLATRQSS